MASIFWQLKQFEEESCLLRAGLRDHRRFLGKEHGYVGSDLLNLSVVEAKQGNIEKSIRLCRDAIPVIRKFYGNEHEETAKAYNNLALLLKKTGRLNEAKHMFEKAHQAIETVPYTNNGVDNIAHPVSLYVRSGLAGVLVLLGEKQEAEQLYAEVYEEHQKRNVGDQSQMDLAYDQNNVANMLCAKGLYEQAKNMYKKALKQMSAILGKNHPELGPVLSNLAFVTEKTGRAVKAMRMWELAIEMAVRSNGKSGEVYATRVMHLGKLLQRCGNVDTALDCLITATSMFYELGKEDMVLAHCLTGLGVLFRKKGHQHRALHFLSAGMKIILRNTEDENSKQDGDEIDPDVMKEESRIAKNEDESGVRNKRRDVMAAIRKKEGMDGDGDNVDEERIPSNKVDRNKIRAMLGLPPDQQDTSKKKKKDKKKQVQEEKPVEKENDGHESDDSEAEYQMEVDIQRQIAVDEVMQRMENVKYRFQAQYGHASPDSKLGRAIKERQNRDLRVLEDELEEIPSKVASMLVAGNDEAFDPDEVPWLCMYDNENVAPDVDDDFWVEGTVSARAFPKPRRDFTMSHMSVKSNVSKKSLRSGVGGVARKIMSSAEAALKAQNSIEIDEEEDEVEQLAGGSPIQKAKVEFVAELVAEKFPPRGVYVLNTRQERCSKVDIWGDDEDSVRSEPDYIRDTPVTITSESMGGPSDNNSVYSSQNRGTNYLAAPKEAGTISPVFMKQSPLRSRSRSPSVTAAHMEDAVRTGLLSMDLSAGRGSPIMSAMLSVRDRLEEQLMEEEASPDEPESKSLTKVQPLGSIKKQKVEFSQSVSEQLSQTKPGQFILAKFGFKTKEQIQEEKKQREKEDMEKLEQMETSNGVPRKESFHMSMNQAAISEAIDKANRALKDEPFARGNGSITRPVMLGMTKPKRAINASMAVIPQTKTQNISGRDLLASLGPSNGGRQESPPKPISLKSIGKNNLKNAMRRMLNQHKRSFQDLNDTNRSKRSTNRTGKFSNKSVLLSSKGPSTKRSQSSSPEPGRGLPMPTKVDGDESPDGTKGTVSSDYGTNALPQVAIVSPAATKYGNHSQVLPNPTSRLNRSNSITDNMQDLTERPEFHALIARHQGISFDNPGAEEYDNGPDDGFGKMSLFPIEATSQDGYSHMALTDEGFEQKFTLAKTQPPAYTTVISSPVELENEEQKQIRKLALDLSVKRVPILDESRFNTVDSEGPRVRFFGKRPTGFPKKDDTRKLWLMAHEGVAQVLVEMKEWDLAENVQRRLLVGTQYLYGRNHHRTTQVVMMLVRTMMHQERFELAEKVCLKLQELAEAVNGKGSLRNHDVGFLLGELYIQSGQVERGEALQQEINKARFEAERELEAARLLAEERRRQKAEILLMQYEDHYAYLREDWDRKLIQMSTIQEDIAEWKARQEVRRQRALERVQQQRKEDGAGAGAGGATNRSNVSLTTARGTSTSGFTTSRGGGGGMLTSKKRGIKTTATGKGGGGMTTARGSHGQVTTRSGYGAHAQATSRGAGAQPTARATSRVSVRGGGGEMTARGRSSAAIAAKNEETFESGIDRDY